MNHTYDASLEKCPLPLVKLRVLLKKMQPGDTCWLKIADSGSKQDIPKLLAKQGYSFSITELGACTELLIKSK